MSGHERAEAPDICRASGTAGVGLEYRPAGVSINIHTAYKP